MSPLVQSSALELARHIARRDVSCAEVIEAHLRRIEEVNPHCNAIVRLMADEARAAARTADARVAGGETLGPLHGVPFTVKENIDLAGTPTTWGVAGLAHARAPIDAPVVERLRAAGAIPIGRTNMPDWALRIHTDSSLHGLTRNPWDPARTAGGSSGGDAVALATGMCALGLGNDLGGSLRSPAGACGVVSLRPSAGRVPDAGMVPGEDRLLSFQTMNVQGPMARRVADLRAALAVLSGAHPRDPLALDAPFDAGARSRPGRVAVLAEPPGGRTDPAVADAVRRAAAALAEAGYEVVEACPPRFEEAVGAWAQLLVGDLDLALPRMQPLMGEDARRFVDAVRHAVPGFATPMSLSELMMRRDAIARAWSQFLAETPLILSPCWTHLPFDAGADVASPEGTGAAIETMRPVVPANLLGLPSACVPAGLDPATGLPIGVLLTGARWHDGRCLDAAEAVEARLAPATPIDPVKASRPSAAPRQR